ncbi:hypothetical protein [Mesorhizobium sp. B2-3-5]|uniref:hypothetical protein n=1 Tax=Mesorhizobium sp. B2-3-5 TaxID=2589958 RepID=UPI001125B712|nr:hypothetical protein [Mesorhizobium sp. B2-3-5]TPM16319.1 hypothetical protein FJ958_29160 [Mesorhizobium sp. B2-3-5]
MLKTYIVIATVAILSIGQQYRISHYVNSTDDNQLPVGSIDLFVDDASRSLFFEKLRQFSERNSFKIRIAPTTPDEIYYTIQVNGNDMFIIGGNTLGIKQPQDVTLALYKNDVGKMDDGRIRDIASQIVSLFGNVAGVSVKRAAVNRK